MKKYFQLLLVFALAVVACEKTPVTPEEGGGGKGPLGVECSVELQDGVLGYSEVLTPATGVFYFKAGNSSYTYQLAWRVDEGERKTRTVKPGDVISLNDELALATSFGEHSVTYGLRCAERTGSLVEGTESFWVCGAPLESVTGSYLPINDAVSTLTSGDVHQVYIGQEGVIRFDYNPSNTILGSSVSVVGDVVCDITASPSSNVAGRIEYGFKVKGEGKQDVTFVFTNGLHTDEFKVQFVTVGALSGPTIVANYYRNYLKGHDMELSLTLADWDRMDIPFIVDISIDGEKVISSSNVDMSAGQVFLLETSGLPSGMHELKVNVSSLVAGVIASEMVENFWMHDVSKLPVKTASGVSELSTGQTLEGVYRSPVSVIVPEVLSDVLYMTAEGNCSFNQGSFELVPYRGVSSLVVRNKGDKKAVFKVSVETTQNVTLTVSPLNDACIFDSRPTSEFVERAIENMVSGFYSSVKTDGFGEEETLTYLCEYEVDYEVYLYCCTPGSSSSDNNFYKSSYFTTTFHGTYVCTPSSSYFTFTDDMQGEISEKVWEAYNKEKEYRMPRLIWRDEKGDIHQDTALPGVTFSGARLKISATNTPEKDYLKTTVNATAPTSSGAKFSVTLSD